MNARIVRVVLLVSFAVCLAGCRQQMADQPRGFKLRGRDVPLREVPVGYIFDVISRGYGAMADYAAQVPVPDRWAIVAHVRVLQLSQRLRLDDLPAEERAAHFGKGGAP